MGWFGLVESHPWRYPYPYALDNLCSFALIYRRVGRYRS